MVRITTLVWRARELISPSKVEDRPFVFATAAFGTSERRRLFSLKAARSRPVPLFFKF
jgi:hypothetical protein